MQIEQVTVGMLATNCYFLIDPETKETLVIDPGADGEKLWKFIQDEGLKVIGIVNTHGHGDHIGANGFLHEKTGAPLYIHEDDAAMLEDSTKNLSVYVGPRMESPKAQAFIKEGEQLKVGKETVKVVHTPGHTRGGICLIGDNFVIAGDTLFAGSVGRTDLPGGSFKQLLASIKEKLLILPDGTEVYPGHGPTTTIGYERQHNEFLNF